MELARDEPHVRRALEVCPASRSGVRWGHNPSGWCAREAVLRGYLSSSLSQWGAAHCEEHLGQSARLLAGQRIYCPATEEMLCRRLSRYCRIQRKSLSAVLRRVEGVTSPQSGLFVPRTR